MFNSSLFFKTQFELTKVVIPRSIPLANSQFKPDRTYERRKWAPSWRRVSWPSLAPRSAYPLSRPAFRSRCDAVWSPLTRKNKRWSPGGWYNRPVTWSRCCTSCSCPHQWCSGMGNRTPAFYSCANENPWIFRRCNAGFYLSISM